MEISFGGKRGKNLESNEKLGGDLESTNELNVSGLTTTLLSICSALTELQECGVMFFFMFLVNVYINKKAMNTPKED